MSAPEHAGARHLSVTDGHCSAWPGRLACAIGPNGPGAPSLLRPLSPRRKHRLSASCTGAVLGQLPRSGLISGAPGSLVGDARSAHGLGALMRAAAPLAGLKKLEHQMTAEMDRAAGQNQ